MLNLFIFGLFGFIITYLVTPKLVIFLNNIGVVGHDLQKKNYPKVVEMGGLPVLIGFLAGILFYIGFLTFSGISGSFTEIFAVILTIMIITLIGILDDLTALLKKKDFPERVKPLKKIGFKQKHKFLLPLVAALPLIAINSGVSTINLPIIHSVDIGILYPFFIIPLAIFGASNATNMLAGLNGLEAGMGFVLISSLGIYSYLNASVVAVTIAIIFAACLLAFLKYNWYPSKIFPGDSLTYTIGAVAATIAIVGNMEKFAIFIFLPWFLEFGLKARSGFQAESFGILQVDGTLKAPHKKIYSLTHLIMKIRPFSEKKVVSILIITEIVISFSGFLLFL